MEIDCWLNSSLERVYKHDTPKISNSLELKLAKNDRRSFQVCLRKNNPGLIKVELEVQSPSEIDVQARRIGHVAIPHHTTNTDEAELVGELPGYVPDPLFTDLSMELYSNETNSYWITVKTKKDVSPGSYPLKIKILSKGNEICELETNIKVYNLKIEKRINFPITHWFYVDAICDYYDFELFDSDFWNMTSKYVRNLVDHGINVLYTPIFTPPTDGIKRPTQLLKIKRHSNEEYKFDWTDVKKWVDMAKKNNVDYFEWTHLFSQWGAKYAIRIYENYDDNYDNRLLWPPKTDANSEIYQNFLEQFLPEFKSFLKREDILDKSFFHLSDEPHGEADLKKYREARKIISKIAPWMKIMDALSEKEFAKKGLTDMPISSIKNSIEFNKNNIDHWDYYCCLPKGKYLNRFMDTPLAKINGNGWLFYKFNAKGFLHWGYNYWYKSQSNELIDPYFVADGLNWPDWAFGDTFMVYPGEEGPIDSIRWEIFAESLKDYALLQTLNIDRSSDILSAFKSYQDFPKNKDWYLIKRALLLETNS